ncbi:zeta toxin family protein [Rhizobium terrae]|uniref:zeta toxin family protein n=1 Tax=Rhizobium terrae TaxID=2171756 RepID=UPI000E3BCE50|nr:zeta toxin family protein [Rhizobium terrae]
MSDLRPFCCILAGPNGAGKSTIYKNLALSGIFVNADEVAREVNPSDPEASSLQAGRLVLLRLGELIATKQSFIYETTLSSHQSVSLLQKVSRAGYQTLLIFVALATPDLHIKRVEQRVSRGGHNIPEHIIRRRYDISFQNLIACLSVSETTMIFDNSAAGARLVVEIEDGKIVRSHADPSNPFDRRLAACVAAGLSLPLQTILPPEA